MYTKLNLSASVKKGKFPVIEAILMFLDSDLGPGK